MLKGHSVAIFIRLAVVASQIYEISQNSPKIRTYRSSRSSSHRSCCQSKAHRLCHLNYQSLIVTLDVSPTIFEILTHLARKQLVFPPHPCLTPFSRGTPCDINVIYTQLKSTINGFVAGNMVYLHSFSRCGLPNLLYPAKFPENSAYDSNTAVFSARQHIALAQRAIARRPVCLSVRLSVTWVNQSKVVEDSIMKFSPYGILIPLVFTW